MPRFDLHCHTHFSYDAAKDSSADALCRRAIELGITDLCITDHCDMDSATGGLLYPYDEDAAWGEALEAKDRYRDRLNLMLGIELGNAHHAPKKAAEVLARHPYEFVIGSLHNLRGMLDFWDFEFRPMPQKEIESFFGRMLGETRELIAVPGLTTLGHLTYMLRYVALAGRTFDMQPWFDRIEPLFRDVVARGLALEINVSTLWKGLGFSMPSLELLRLYRDCGGRVVTIGSDAHSPADLGRSIDEGLSILRAVGLTKIRVVRRGLVQEIEL